MNRALVRRQASLSVSTFPFVAKTGVLVLQQETSSLFRNENGLPQMLRNVLFTSDHDLETSDRFCYLYDHGLCSQP